ncbi:transporter, CPA2 family [Sulfurivirga caldicuralii]|uniref:Transporter, CPA2 family n=1 Tax=Sulfurivirga caldicuralii TaxID=364032 RepID=A0A1N6DPM1_9GAMM|nr:cation:proton antiporter [Sulfurivirga caldicuralii]SIN72735.1 transporter, CPA2 family [Sulfurivirga caldicuralii]
MEAHAFLLQLFLILVSARIFAELFARMGIPPVLGEVTAGLMLGPSLLGWVHMNDMIRLLAEIGIILLLFEIGLEVDVEKLKAHTFNAVTVALTGVVLPFAGGFAVSRYGFDLPLLTSLFIGGTLTATSIGITLRVLRDLKLTHTTAAQVVVGAAVLDDIVGVVLLVLLADFALTGQVSWSHTLRTLGMLALFLAVAPLLASVMSHFLRTYELRYRGLPGFVPTFIIALVLFFAWVAHLFGAPEILGAFAAGVALSRRFIVPFAAFIQTDERFTEAVNQQMQPLIHLFTPIFFVSVGLAVDLTVVHWNSPAFWALGGVLLLVAVASKVAAGLILPRMEARERWRIGVAMVPRGEVGLIFAELGRTAKLFTQDIYAVMIFVVILSTLLPPLWLKRMTGSEQESSTPSLRERDE